MRRPDAPQLRVSAEQSRGQVEVPVISVPPQPDPNYCEWLFMWLHARVQVFHGGGPRVKHQIERPISDVVVTENLIGSLT